MGDVSGTVECVYDCRHCTDDLSSFRILSVFFVPLIIQCYFAICQPRGIRVPSASREAIFALFPAIRGAISIAAACRAAAFRASHTGRTLDFDGAAGGRPGRAPGLHPLLQGATSVRPVPRSMLGSTCR